MRTCVCMGRRPPPPPPALYIPMKNNSSTLKHHYHYHYHSSSRHIIAFRFPYDNFIFLLFIILSILMASSSSSINKSLVVAAAAAPTDPSTAVLIRVDQSGRGDFTTIQAAIDAVPSNNDHFVFIWIKPGVYKEKVVVPGDKPYITLSGTQARDTIITWHDHGDNIYDSPTVSILASGFVGRYLTFQNSYGSRGKGVALRVSGDKAAFYSCRILSFQDTLLDDLGRHYYSNCYIEGATDFICGNAASLFEKCHLHSINEVGYASITAQKRKTPWENTGFIFLGCKITGAGVHKAFLGRPWDTYSRVIYAYSFISTAIAPQGWNNWGDITKERTAYYGEYKCYGAGANRRERVEWSKDLTSEEAAPFLSKDMIGGRGWLRPAPTTFTKGFANIAPVSSPQQ